MADGGDGPRAVRQIDYEWITMRDGTRLAARIWLPDDADGRPGAGRSSRPCPYRLSDGMAPRDALIHPCWAAHGYACVRVDLRGSGESDGVLERRVPRRRSRRTSSRSSPGSRRSRGAPAPSA